MSLDGSTTTGKILHYSIQIIFVLQLHYTFVHMYVYGITSDVTLLHSIKYSSLEGFIFAFSFLLYYKKLKYLYPHVRLAVTLAIMSFAANFRLMAHTGNFVSAFAVGLTLYVMFRMDIIHGFLQDEKILKPIGTILASGAFSIVYLNVFYSQLHIGYNAVFYAVYFLAYLSFYPLINDYELKAPLMIYPVRII